MIEIIWIIITICYIGILLSYFKLYKNTKETNKKLINLLLNKIRALELTNDYILKQINEKKKVGRPKKEEK